MFNQPITFVKKKEETLNLNTALNFTEKAIHCGGEVGSISYEELFKTRVNPTALCLLNTNKTLTLSTLRSKLSDDFSFKEAANFDSANVDGKSMIM